METESVDESTRSSVSSLKSRFEQLATREIKLGPDTQSSQATVRPPSGERPGTEDEKKSRASIDEGRPIRTSSPQPPPRPKPKPRITPLERATGLAPLRSPQLLPTPRKDGRRTVSLSPRNPVITVESPQSPAAPITLAETISGPPPTPLRPTLPPRSGTVGGSANGKPPLSPRPAREKLEDCPRTPESPRTPPPPPSRSPKVPTTSPFTTPPEEKDKRALWNSKTNTVEPIPFPPKPLRAATDGVVLQPPAATPPELPQRPISPSQTESIKPVLPPRPNEGDAKRIFERPPPSRLHTQALPTRSNTMTKPHKSTQITVSQFLPPPQRANSIVPTPMIKENEIPVLQSRVSSSASLSATQSAPDVSSGTELDIDGSSSETEVSEKQPPAFSAYPDASRANRKPPFILGRQGSLPTNMSIKHVCVSGPYIAVSSSDLTRVFNLKKDVGSSCIWSYAHPHSNDGYKVTSMEFKPCRDVNSEGSWLWIGTDKGGLMEFDLLSGSHGPAEKRGNVHTSSVNAILRCRLSLWSIDESGKVQVWTTPEDGVGEISMTNSPKTFRVVPRWTVGFVAGCRLWLGQGRQVQVYSPLLLNGDAFNVTQRPIALPSGKTAGVVTCGTTLSTDKDRVFVGHDDGKVSIYSQKTLTCLDVVPINIYNIATLAGVGEYLWAGFRTGMIYVYDTSNTPWRVCKDWEAHHKMKITHLMSDQTTLWRAGVGIVISVGEEGMVRLWDALLMDDWLENEMQKREVEYCAFRDINIVLCTWNAGASKPSDLNRGSLPEHNFLENVLQSMDSPDIIVFGFQELVDLENKKLTASILLYEITNKESILKGKSKGKVNPAIQEHMSHQYRVWQEKLVSALKIATSTQDDPYVLLHSATLVGLFTCIFVRHREKSNVRNLSATEVKTGLGGLHGNKGALVVRFIIDDSSLCFVNCHLAAGQSHTTQRNNDIANILEFAALPRELNDAMKLDYFVGGGDGSMILDHELCILNGDMNYRIDLPRETVLAAIRRNDFEKLLEHDQLLTQRRKNPGFRLRPFSEAPITFAPTYKYNVGSDEYDTSEKKRTPAWCDRIYYRGAADKITPVKYQRHEVYASDHRPVSGAFVASVKMVDPQRKQKVWDETAKLWISVAQKAIDDAKVDYISGTYGFNEIKTRMALHQKAGKISETVRLLLEG